MSFNNGWRLRRAFLGAALAATSLAVFADVKTDQAIAKAEEQFAKGKPDDAIKSLAKHVNGSPSVEGFLALARLQGRNGEANEARASVARAVEASSSAGPTLKARALAMASASALENGTGRDALEKATEAAAAERNATSLAAMALSQVRTGDLAAARSNLEAAMAADANASAAHRARGAVLLESGDLVAAVASFRKAAELDPGDAAAHADLAFALIAAGQAEDARAAAQKAVEANRASGSAYAALGLAISASKNFNGADPSWSDAIAQAQQGVFLSPKSPRAHAAVARLFEVRGDFIQAKEAYARAVSADPGFTRARAALARMKYLTGDIDGALVDADALVKSSPQDAEGNRLLGELRARKGQYKDAIPALERAASALPDDKDTIAILAHSYHMTNSLEDAKNAYAKAVRLNPANSELQSNYGLLLGMSGETDKGVEILRALTSAPGYRSAAGFANYGWVLSRTKPPRGEEAIAAYGRALQMEPSNGQLHYGLAWAQVFAGKPKEALLSFEKASSLDKLLFPETRRGIARAHYRLAVATSAENKTAPDFTATKEALVIAENAGRPDVPTATAIEKYENEVKRFANRPAIVAPEIDEPQIDIGKWSRQLQKGSPAQRAEAASVLAGAGADAVEILGYSIETDPLARIRRASFDALVRIGPGGARRAGPALRRYLGTPPPPPETGDLTRAGMDVEMMEADLRRDIQQFLVRLR